MLSGWNTPRMFDNFKDGIVTDEFCDTLKVDFPTHNIYRFPGGTVSNKYEISKGGYGDANKTGKNYIYAYIDFLKKVNGKALLVFNLYSDMVAEKPIKLSENLQMLKIVQDAGIEVVGIELGNELYMYFECTGVKGRVNALNRRRFTKKLELYKNICGAYKNMIPKGIKIGVPFESYLSERGRMWNAVAETIGDAVCPHYYTQLSNINEVKFDFVNKLPKSDMEVWVTEFNYAFGAFGTENIGMKGSVEMQELHKNFPLVCAEYGVKMLINHSLYGENVYNHYAPN